MNIPTDFFFQRRELEEDKIILYDMKQLEKKGNQSLRLKLPVMLPPVPPGAPAPPMAASPKHGVPVTPHVAATAQPNVEPSDGPAPSFPS